MFQQRQECMSVYVSQHDIVSAYCLDEASGPGMWEIQRDIMDALMDHPTLTREQVYEALAGVAHAFAWHDEQVRKGRLPGAS